MLLTTCIRHLFRFIADNALEVEVSDPTNVSISINKTAVEVATIFFNEAISFVPCFKYADSEDVILFASPNIHYLVDQGGQFCTDYYGMKHELIECITSEEIYVDLNDEHVFKSFKLSELRTESKTVVYFPDYLLQAFVEEICMYFKRKRVKLAPGFCAISIDSQTSKNFLAGGTGAEP
jgi:hypothetical protein